MDSLSSKMLCNSSCLARSSGSAAYEMVYTITDWYDGARAGVADLKGKPHYYECRWDDAQDDWSEIWLLKPIDHETFRLALEDWQIWERWRAAFDAARATIETIQRFGLIFPQLAANQRRKAAICRGFPFPAATK